MVNLKFSHQQRAKLVSYMVVEKTIQKIPVMPFALMLACIGAVIGVIIGIFYAAVFGAIFSTILQNLPSTTGSTRVIPSFFGVIFGVGAIVIMPITMFIGGLIHGIIIAALYNFLAPRIGGIKIQFKEDTPAAAT